MVRPPYFMVYGGNLVTRQFERWEGKTPVRGNIDMWTKTYYETPGDFFPPYLDPREECQGKFEMSTAPGMINYGTYLDSAHWPKEKE
ncbi:MAG: hypothetical protein ACLFWL_10275 [Candidatus Brocadiia bacterium]